MLRLSWWRDIYGAWNNCFSYCFTNLCCDAWHCNCISSKCLKNQFRLPMSVTATHVTCHVSARRHSISVWLLFFFLTIFGRLKVILIPMFVLIKIYLRTLKLKTAWLTINWLVVWIIISLLCGMNLVDHTRQG